MNYYTLYTIYLKGKRKMIKTLEEAENAWKELEVIAEVTAGAAPTAAKLATPLPVRIGLAILLGKKELI